MLIITLPSLNNLKKVTQVFQNEAIQEVRFNTGVQVSKNEYINGSGEIHLASTYLQKVTPIYVELNGWYDDISDCKLFNQLPHQCINFINYLERITDTKISLISVGPTSSSKIKIS